LGLKKKKAVKSSKAKVSRAKSKLASLKINDQVWPLERDVLFRPDRFKYVRKLIKNEGCVFCTAAKSQAPNLETLCVHQTKHSMVVLNKYPYNSGHVLILPKRHIGNILDLSNEEWVDLQNLVRKTFAVVEKTYQPAGMNMGLNHGAVAGAGLPDHVHYHLVPRWAGDLNFFPLIAETKLVIENLEQSFNRIVESF
jgi:ATP adenylyltransferase